nr:MAG TPA: terminase large subunit [Caudoviricetes sp.]
MSELLAPVFAPVHTDIRRHGHDEYWLYGGRGSGKSSFVSIEIVLGMMKDPQANALVVRRVAKTLRQSVYEQLCWAIDRLGVDHLWARRLSPMELSYRPTGQRILFIGADDPQKSKGIKVSRGNFKFLWFEELAEFDGMGAVNTITASAVRGDAAVTFYTYNPPESIANWVNEEALCIHEGRLSHKSSYLDIPPKWLGASFLSKADIMRRTNERAYRHMYLGEVTGTGGQVFENVELRPIPEGEISRMGAFYDGLDFGYYPDPTHWVRVSYDPSRLTIYVVDELRRYRTTDREFARLLMERRDVTASTEIICDSASEKPLAELRSEGLRSVVGAMKGRGSIETGIRWLRMRARIVIDPTRTPETAKEFAQYEFVKLKNGSFTESYPDRDNHAIDAVRYALNRVWLRKDR